MERHSSLQDHHLPRRSAARHQPRSRGACAQTEAHFAFVPPLFGGMRRTNAVTFLALYLPLQHLHIRAMLQSSGFGHGPRVQSHAIGRPLNATGRLEILMTGQIRWIAVRFDSMEDVKNSTAGSRHCRTACIAPVWRPLAALRQRWPQIDNLSLTYLAKGRTDCAGLDVGRWLAAGTIAQASLIQPPGHASLRAHVRSRRPMDQTRHSKARARA